MDSAFLFNQVMDPVIAAALRSHRQRQQGGAHLPYFSSPVAYQRGRGLGSLVRSIFRPIKTLFKKPVVRKGLKKLGTAAAQALVDAGQQALQEEDVSFKSALKQTSKEQAKDLLKQVKQGMTGQGPSMLLPLMRGLPSTTLSIEGKRKKGGIKRKRPASRKPALVKNRRVALDIFE